MANATPDYYITSTTGSIGGSGNLAKSGSGALTISGANTCSGGTILSVGTLNINDNSAIGTGLLTIQGGTIDNTGFGDVTLSSNNAQNWDGNFTFNGTLGLNLGTGAVTPNADRQITVNLNTLTVGGPIGGGTVSLTKAGLGNLSLSGASTYSGGTIPSAGQLNINNGGSSAANSAIGTGPLTIMGGTFLDNTSGSDVTLLPTIDQTWAGNWTYFGIGNNLNLGNGAVTLTGGRTVTVFANTLTVGGTISGSASLSKAGAGTLVLTGANSFTGNMNLNEGTLMVGNDRAAGAATLNLDNATVIMSTDSSSRTMTNALNFNGTDANLTFGGTGDLIFTGNNSGNSSGKTFTVNNQTEFQGNVSGTTRNIARTGKMIISGTTTYSGTTIYPGATLQVGNGGNTGTISGSSGTIANDGTLIINRNDTVFQSAGLGAGGISGYGSIIHDGEGTTMLNHVIDTDIVRDGSNYYRFSKDEQFKAITMEISDKLMGPWLDVPRFSLSKLQGYEGPQCYQLKPAAEGKPAKWCLLLDHYRKGAGYEPFVTDDLSSGQFTAAPNFSFPFRFHHGSVLPVTDAEYGRLKAAFGKEIEPQKTQ